MYKAFFKLREQPFNLTPDPRFVYLSPGHQDALEHMLYGVRERKGFVLITGHIGAGKTTLTRLLMDQLGENVHVALIFNTFLNEIELLRAINREFGLPARSASRETLIGALNRFLIKVLGEGGAALLILDEAQNLSVAVLEQIRMLSNLETDDRKLIQIILVGQPELNRVLARPDLAQLTQRITVRCNLEPLNPEDTVRYIHHRLTIAGSQGLVRFEPAACRLIHRYSAGVPRKINALCDRALLIAFARGSHLIGARFIRQAEAELAGQTPQGWQSRLAAFLRARPAVPAALLALAAFLAVYFGLTRSGWLWP